MTDASPREKITYRTSGRGAQEKTVIADSAGNQIRVSREFDRGMQAHPEKYQRVCQGDASVSITPAEFLAILNTLERYDTKLPWKQVGDGTEKIYFVPPGMIAGKCPKNEMAADL